MREQILTQVIAKLSTLGIPFQLGQMADITIQAELLDASWSTGSKKILYEASVFLNEAERVVYMYEKTTEVGHGFSFGESSSSSFQSGATLFRKVKRVQYGPDGKAYEYTLDLGAIPKAVKEAAKSCGWNFKTVIQKSKAAYPAGYAPTFPIAAQAQPVSSAPKADARFCSNCGKQLAPNDKFCNHCGSPVDVMGQQTSHATQEPAASQPQAQQQQYARPQAAPPEQIPEKSGGAAQIFGLVGFILLGLFFAAMLAIGKNSWVGWVLCTVIFSGAFLLQSKLRKKGCLLKLLVWLATAAMLFVILGVTATGSKTFTTAKLKNAHMTTEMDAQGVPVDEVSAYSVYAPELIVVAELHNAPDHTQVKFVWRYVTGDLPIAEYTMDSGENATSAYVFSNVTNDKLWPVGNYRVDMYIEDRETPDCSVAFEVTAD